MGDLELLGANGYQKTRIRSMESAMFRRREMNKVIQLMAIEEVIKMDVALQF